jgi:hypothetical protein
MKTMIWSLAAAALLATATAAPAAVRTAQGEETKAEAANGKASGEKKICKRLETSGTRMTERACLTKAEWKKIEDMD